MSLDSVSSPQHAPLHAPTSTVQVIGTRWAVAAGHALASEAAACVLWAGGNAIDAGVAAGLTLGVVHPDMVSVAGVAPILVHVARTGETFQVSGVGPYPRASSVAYFRERHGGQIPPGLPRTVVPAAPDAWLTALERWGTMSFGDVARAATEHAERGFPVSTFSAYQMATNADKYRRWPTSVALFLRDERAYRAGEILVQRELGETLRRMARAEAKAGGSREAGIRAARDEFYRGETARRIAEFHRASGGPLTDEDLAEFGVEVAPALTTPFGAWDVAACGFWCQGPVLLQMLNLLNGVDLAALGHNAPAYLHRIVETVKLAFADRDAYYGDPRFVAIPVTGLLSKAYAEARRALVGARAWPEMPPAGDPHRLTAERRREAARIRRSQAGRLTRSTRATSPSSTGRGTGSRPRRAIPMWTRPSCRASAASSRLAARRAGSIRNTRAWWRPASGPASRPRRRWRSPEGGCSWRSARRAATSSNRRCSRSSSMSRSSAWSRRPRWRRRAWPRAASPTRSGRTRWPPARWRSSGGFHARPVTRSRPSATSSPSGPSSSGVRARCASCASGPTTRAGPAPIHGAARSRSPAR